MANIGVIAGIVFLAIEIRQNTEMVRSQTRDSITEKQIAVFEWFAASTENSRIRMEGGRLALDPDSPEASQYGWMIAGNLRLWENEWYQYQQGLFEPEEFEPRINMWNRMIDNEPGLRKMWETQRDSYSPGFKALIDSLIDEPVQ
jgi:hypothetical protein